MSWKIGLLTAALGGALTLGVASPARADDEGRGCGRQVQNWERKFDRDTARFGFFSHQAIRDRQRLREARARCGSIWWNGRDRDDGWWRNNGRWRNDHDRDDRWRRNDHDRDDRGFRNRDRDRDRDHGRHRGNH